MGWGNVVTIDDRPQGSGPPKEPALRLAQAPGNTEASAVHPEQHGRDLRLVSEHMSLNAQVTVIIPAMNEAKNLPYVFATLPGWIEEVILVDGRSTDDTVAVARRLCPDVVVVRQPGRGKGDALLAGFGASTGDIIVTMDADGSTDGQEIVRFVAALAAGADFVKGSRFASGGGSADLTAIRRLGNRILSGLVNRLFGTQYTDLCYGFNAFWSRHLAALALECEGFEVETLMNIRAAEAGLRVHEVPSFELRRVHGMSNLRVVIDGWRIAVVILRLWGLHWRTHGFSPGSFRARSMASPRRAELLNDVEATPAQVGLLSGTGAATHDGSLSRGDPPYGSVAL